MLIEKNLEELTIGDKYINKRVLFPSEFHTPNDVFLRNNMLRKKKYLAKLLKNCEKLKIVDNEF